MKTVDPPQAAPFADRYSVRRFAGCSGLHEIADEWRALAGTQERRWFHHLPEWYECYIDALDSNDGALFFYAISVDDVLHAVVPLTATRMRVLGTQRRVMTLPFNDHIPFGDVICRPGADVSAIGAALLKHLELESGVRWDLLVLPHVLEGSAAEHLAASAAPLRSAHRAQGHCDFLSVGEKTSVRDLISGKFARDLRRRMGKLQALGSVEFAVATDGEDLATAFAAFLRVEASGWKGAHGSGTAIALHPELVRFYQAILDRFAPLGACEISELRLDGKCVAAQFAVMIDGAWYLLKMGYDESLAAMAPGNLLVEHALDRLCRGGGVSEANLVSDASWHRSWGPASARVTTYFVANTTVIGILTVALLRLRERMLDRRAAHGADAAHEAKELTASQAGASPRESSHSAHAAAGR